MDLETIKICKRCLLSKSLKNDFNVNKSKEDGRQIYCKVCTKLYAKERKLEIAKQYEKHNSLLYRRINTQNEKETREKDKRSMFETLADLEGYKLIDNLSFHSGDGGYKDYIDKINSSKA